MKTGFKDSLALKNKEKKEKSPWNFDAPHYDARTSCYVNAGTHYGVGHKNPVGSEKITRSYKQIIPEGRVDTLSLYHNGRDAEIKQD